MTQSATHTTSWANTFTEARARTVMAKVLDDFMVLASTGLIAGATLKTWHDELTYAVVNEAAEMFQLKFELPSGELKALNFVVRDDGTLSQDAESGGVNYFSLPAGTKVRLTLRYRTGSANLEKVRKYLQERGWGSNGTILEGTLQQDRAYSKDGYGIARATVGDWS